MGDSATKCPPGLWCLSVFVWLSTPLFSIQILYRANSLHGCVPHFSPSSRQIAEVSEELNVLAPTTTPQWNLPKNTASWMFSLWELPWRSRTCLPLFSVSMTLTGRLHMSVCFQYKSMYSDITLFITRHSVRLCGNPLLHHFYSMRQQNRKKESKNLQRSWKKTSPLGTIAL